MNQPNPPIAAARLKKVSPLRPTLAIVLGSGFHHVLTELRVEKKVPYAKIPGFPVPGVSGHAGELFFGHLGGTPVLVLSGRAHFYEGHSMERVTFAIRALASFGIRDLLLTNAAGGINKIFRPGDFMVLTDHINFMGTNPLRGETAPGAYVCVEIADNGDGIEPDVLPRIFEPFFTTKKGIHRGLGLALVYGIVSNHGGGVAVSSQPGAGTSARVYLPAEKHFVLDSTGVDDDLQGTETILVVDDESLMLTMAETILTEYGYKVLTANSGQKALAILSRDDAKVDLVVTDLVMPGMGGRELVERIQQLAPKVRILCTSGYVMPADKQTGTVYLQKPFTSAELLIKVKQALVRTTAID
jgi:CheY-like chemotaxis protein